MSKNVLDRWFETRARSSARTTSRRSVIRGLGAMLLGVSAYPLLPVWRSAHAGDLKAGGGEHSDQDPGDPKDCNYWRYCAIDGFLSSCCGGTVSSCPPGTVMSPVTWIGTCQNPADGKEYFISYNDCCGHSACGRCQCMRNEGDTPAYRPATSNNVNWCSGSSANAMYNSSTAIIVGVKK